MTETTYGILVGYDGSDCGERALEWAIDEARMRRTRLTICHVWQYPYTGFMGGTVTVDFEREAKRMLEAAVAQARLAAPDLEIQPLLACGSAATSLIGFGVDSDLVVVGTHGLSGVRELMLGSVSAQVAAHAGSPVIVVRGLVDPPPEYYPGRIVVGADGSPAADRALALAFDEAQLRDLPLTAICCWSKPDWDAAGTPYIDQDGLRTFAWERFEKAVDRLRETHPGVKAEAELTDVPVFEALRAAATSARLLVLGSRGVSAVRGRLLGSVSQTMLHHAPCPVALVHAPESVPAPVPQG
jgi:nucleotide-binding universal stress UspA family protein